MSDKPEYCCKACGMAVIVLPDQAPIRACACNATIIANMDAVVTEHGGAAA